MSFRRFTSKLGARAVTTAALGLALLLTACRGPAAPTLSVEAVSRRQDVGMRIDVPRKEIQKGGYGLLGTGMTANTLQVTELDVQLSGPGFLAPITPREGSEVEVKSETVVTQFRDVYAGPNRYVKVEARNGAQKLHQLGGVTDVVLNQTNQIAIGLATTPTAGIVEKLAKVSPEALQGDLTDSTTAFSNRRLQAWLDKVTRATGVNRYPMAYSDTNRTFYTAPGGALDLANPSIHPYLINAQAIADALRANSLNPVTLDAFLLDPTAGALNLSTATARDFVLHPGRVEVLTPALPDGSRLWVNDPISPIYEVNGTNNTTTTWVFDQVAPTFEGATPVDWTFTLVTPTQIITRQFSIPRATLNAARPAKVVIDLTVPIATADPDYTINAIVLNEGEYDPAAPNVQLQGREVKQLFAYGRTASGTVALLTPDLFSWDVKDPATTTGALERLKVGNGASSPIVLNDYGLLYPLGETDPASAADVIEVEATLIASSTLKGDIGVTISHLGMTTGDATLSVTSDLTYLTSDLGSTFPKPVDDTLSTRPRINDTITLPNQFVTRKLKLIEPDTPPGTTYRWIAENPLVKFADPFAGPVADIYALGEFPGNVRVTCYSSTGRYASGWVNAVFQTGNVTATVQGDGTQASFFKLTDYVELPENNPGAPTFNAGFAPVPVSSPYPLGGHLADRLAVIYMAASDPTEPDEGRFFWRSSDPLTITIEPATSPVDLAPVDPPRPTRRARLTALREGTVTITAMDRKGREINTPITFTFRRGLVGGTISLPINPYAISMVAGFNRASGEAALAQGPSATCEMRAVEANQATPKFNWVSGDTLKLKIDPMPGYPFPSDRAMFTTLRSGSVSFQLISANTEKMSAGLPLPGQETNFSSNWSHPFALYVSYTGAAVTSSTFTGKTLLVRKQGDPAFGTSGTAVALNKVVRLEAFDPDDAGGEIVWTTDNAREAQLLSRTGPAIDVRLMKTGPHVFRVYNHRTNKSGVYTLTVTNGTADATIRITL